MNSEFRKSAYWLCKKYVKYPDRHLLPAGAIMFFLYEAAFNIIRWNPTFQDFLRIIVTFGSWRILPLNPCYNYFRRQGREAETRRKRKEVIIIKAHKYPNLDNERIKRSMSQIEFADLLGITPSAYSKRQRGCIKGNCGASWNRYAETLNVKASYLKVVNPEFAKQNLRTGQNRPHAGKRRRGEK